MRNEDFEVFIDEFGAATHRIDVPAEAIQKWRGKPPDLLLTYWQEEGWSGYANGLFGIVNPDDYEDGGLKNQLEHRNTGCEFRVTALSKDRSDDQVTLCPNKSSVQGLDG